MSIVMTEFQFHNLFMTYPHSFTGEGLATIFHHLDTGGGRVQVDAPMICNGFGEGDAEDVLKHCGFPTLAKMQESTFAVETSEGRIVYSKEY